MISYVSNQIQDMTSSNWSLLFQLTIKNFASHNCITNEYLSNPETIYRLHTFNKVKDKAIWHIHGEVDYPRTIMLGQEKYSNSLSRIINYTVKRSDSKFSDGVRSWVDLFLCSDVHIIGFGFDFSEIDLWWVLNYRARVKFQNEISINNKIVFHVRKSNNVNPDYNVRNKSLIRLLKSHDVDVKEYDLSYIDLYKEVISNF